MDRYWCEDCKNDYYPDKLPDYHSCVNCGSYNVYEIKKDNVGEID